ncbi:hypothetical protein O59_000324 [Cellvibrio sp. BR]|nr:hypothetical protein O59_000324 [Cellvibrio sp. BR]
MGVIPCYGPLAYLTSLFVMHFVLWTAASAAQKPNLLPADWLYQ